MSSAIKKLGFGELLCVQAILALPAQVAAQIADANPVEVTPLGQSALQPTAAAEVTAGDAVVDELGGVRMASDHQVDPAELVEISGITGRRASTAVDAPNPPGNSVALVNSGFTGFHGLNHRDQVLAGGGTQLSVEPPDAALCVGNGFIVEAVNNALAVFQEDGTRLAGPVDLNGLFGLPPEVIYDRQTGRPKFFGPSLTDPRCLFDEATNRFFVTAGETEKDPSTGDPVARSHLLIAVSTSASPTAFNTLSIDTTDHGNPDICPCFGDQPLIGANGEGFFVSTNAFSIFTLRFGGAQIYALSKELLAQGAFTTGVRLSPLPSQTGGFAFSIHPASSPPGQPSEERGTEFLASVDITQQLDNRLLVWAVHGTDTLGTGEPNLSLSATLVATEPFGVPPDAVQKSGTTPLRDMLNALVNRRLGIGWDQIELLSTGDQRLQQVTFRDGRLWTALTTVVGPPTDERSGIAYFAVHAESADDGVRASVEQQGYVSLAGNFLMYPAIVVNGRGGAAIVFSFSGPDSFPSLGYVLIDEAGQAGAIHVAAAGIAPEDGFSGYRAYQPDPTAPQPAARWGDYSAAAVGQDGTLWLAGEYIAPLRRTELADWSTFILGLQIGAGDE
jgi:hypothetical protein